MADHLELVSEIPKVEKLSVQDRLELAKKRRSQQLRRWEREKDKEYGPPPPKKKPQRARPVKFEARIILLEAASRGDCDEVKRMLDYGVDPNLANDDGLTALHQACIDECDEIAELLVGYGANIDAEDRELWTPLHASAACENYSMVQYLVENGADVVSINADGNLPVDLVEEDDDLKKFLHEEMNKYGFNEDKINELALLREKRMLEDIKDAIEKKRDLEIKDMQGATALHVAAANAYEEVLEFLLENDADVDVVDRDGWKPIHAAACWGNEKAIELLVEHGSDLESKTPHGETPLDLCDDADMRQFIIDLKGKMKTNKFKVKNKRRKRNNSRSLSVKRSSLKEKISISQNEAKAEAILRQHPELAFLIAKDKKTDYGSNQLNMSIEDTTLPKKESPSPARPEVDERSAGTYGKEVTENSTTVKYKRTSEVKETVVTNTINVKVVEQGNNEKGNKTLSSTENHIEHLKSERSRELLPKGREATVPGQGTDTTKIQHNSQNDSKEHVLQDKTNSRPSEKIAVPSQPPSGRRQLPVDPRIQQATKENNMVNINHTSQGVVASKVERTPASKTSSELSANSNSTAQTVTSMPKSTKTRAAPPVPRSSGSTGSRTQVPFSDTSGYRDSFSKRKSRDSREISDTALQQLAKDIKESKVISPSDVRLSSDAKNAKYTPNPRIPQLQQQNDTPATLHVSSETVPMSNIIDTNNVTNNSVEEPRRKFKQPAGAPEVGDHKKSCCVII
ncbi:protein phosphatase 1 regulatory subunit 16A-like [Stylophora pistillata]|uniref:Protein phosphatase 1 regulatory inhibitor subunit 16B n=1 Tax=Stylophora pistillata TaxID=50429 RepID=A0A2B4RBD5_STYPI|nr:protein phosphatase 1 regulatory subunit 16A-like [Stylophora pistillata]PFX15664.1 Protein phosphatase 1 regulatory inhibitor subunit 16B [Stylophora pistillata]